MAKTMNIEITIYEDEGKWLCELTDDVLDTSIAYKDEELQRAIKECLIGFIGNVKNITEDNLHEY